MSLPLSESVTRLYEAFEKVRKPKNIDACPCCLNASDLCILTSKSLREITPDELSGYASRVFLTVGGADDFQYFLPRILDVLSTEFGWWPDPEVVGRAIGTFGWTNFSDVQRHALNDYFEAVLGTAMESINPDGGSIDSWLCFCSHFYPSWDVFLERVSRSTSALIALYEAQCPAINEGRLANAFWDDSPRKTEFEAWLHKLIDQGKIKEAYGL